jgi:aminomethyltransferase
LLKKTALNAIHRELGGELTDFGGWEMPLWYSTGSVKEHLAVVEKSGLFDIGHMDLLRVKGKEAFNLIQLCLTRNISALGAGVCGYSMILNEQGHVVDDTIVYNLNKGESGKEEYILIVNASMGRWCGSIWSATAPFRTHPSRTRAAASAKSTFRAPPRPPL